MSTRSTPGAHSFKAGRYYKRMREGKSVMQSAEDIRHEEAITAAQAVMVEAFERNKLPHVFAVMDYTRLAIEAYLTEDK